MSSKANENLTVTVNLRPEVLAVFGFSPDAKPEDVKKRIETFDCIPIIHMDTLAGHVSTGLNFEEEEFPQAFSCLVPKGSTTEIDLTLADFGKARGGDVKLCLFDDPFEEDCTYETTLSRQQVVEAMKSIDDYQEESTNQYNVMKASCEMSRREYKKGGGYHEGIAIENDTEQEKIASFHTMEEAKQYLESKRSYISSFPSNSLVRIEEFYIEEIDENEDLVGYWNVASLHEDSKKYTHDIYATDEKDTLAQGISKEEACEIFGNEKCLFDPKERVLYIPDVTNEGYLHGFQKATFFLSDKELANSLRACDGNTFDVMQWAFSHIPAPGAMQTAKEGRLDHDGIELSFNSDDDIEKWNMEEIDNAIEEYVQDLEKKGILQRMMTEEALAEHLRNLTAERDSVIERFDGATFYKQLMVIEGGGKIDLTKIPVVCKAAREKGFDALADYAEAYPSRYLAFQRDVKKHMESNKHPARI